ncbi:hypothetical protein [uncultured Mameliella sp.]|uniref:hypothetical protein n=1 Tax=uncultured Mameliella sp. TaxID=1447087 RepID=UPI0026376F52|nr:hypothetical protein [uncultured Mameliella sp.]
MGDVGRVGDEAMYDIRKLFDVRSREEMLRMGFSDLQNGRIDASGCQVFVVTPRTNKRHRRLDGVTAKHGLRADIVFSVAANKARRAVTVWAISPDG